MRLNPAFPALTLAAFAFIPSAAAAGPYDTPDTQHMLNDVGDLGVAGGLAPQVLGLYGDVTRATYPPVDLQCDVGASTFVCSASIVCPVLGGQGNVPIIRPPGFAGIAVGPPMLGGGFGPYVGASVYC